MQEIFKKITDQLKESAHQEDTPIYEGDKETDYYIRLSSAIDIINEAAEGEVKC